MNKLPVFVFIFFSISAAAQQQVVHFKDLQQFLPQGEFLNYVRGKADGETSSMMGFTTSWAQVTYSSMPDSNKGTVSIKITDMMNIPSYMSVPPSALNSSSRSTGSGYKRTLNYNNLNVLETYDSTSHQAKLQITLATRFLIEISGAGIIDPGILYSFLDKTDVEGLKKIADNGANNRGR